MPFGKPKEPKAPKEKKPKKPKPPKKEKPPKKPKPPKPAKKPKPPKKVKPPKKPKKGAPPVEGEELEEGKKKIPIFLLLIPVVVIAVAVVLVIRFVLPTFQPKDPDVVVTEEPKPPELPEELKVGEESVPGMVLEADESGAQAVLAKTITYTYTNLVNAGAAAETYVGQLKSADPSFSMVDEEFVRVSEVPDYTAAEGMVLMARNLPKPEPEVKETPAPTEDPEEGSAPPEGESAAPVESQSPEPEESAEPVDEAPDMVLTVRITWSEGQCVVTADEAEGKVTSPPRPSTPGVTPSIGVRDAEAQIQSMAPAELGLEGTSMADYEVFPQNGVEMVNGVTCIRVDVYNGSTGPRPYEFEGSYLMSTDGAHLYRLDPITSEIQELEFTLNQ